MTSLETFVKPRRDRKVYIGAAARLANQNGSLTGCSFLSALFADLDFKDSSESDVRRRLSQTVLRPSVIVQSGGGLQPWWFLREPIDLQHDAAGAKSLLRRLAIALEADIAAAEPARILRVPSTSNFKYQPARPVRVESFDTDRRYNLMDFDEVLPEEPRDVRVLAGPTPDAIPAGQCNVYLTSLAGSMRKRGMSPASMCNALALVSGATLPIPAVKCRPYSIVDEATLHEAASKLDRAVGTLSGTPDGRNERNPAKANRVIS